MLIVFPNWGFDKADAEFVKTWYEQFNNMNDYQFSVMVDSYIKNEKYTPTVAGLLNYKTNDLPEKEYTLEDQLKEIEGDLSLGKEYFEMSNKIEQYNALLEERDRLEQLRGDKGESTVI